MAGESILRVGNTIRISSQGKQKALLSVQIDASLKRELSKLAFGENKSLTQFVEEILSENISVLKEKENND